MWKCKAVCGAVANVALLLSGTVRADDGPIARAADDEPVARAVVSGPEDRVREFHENLTSFLSAFLGTTDPNSILVLCDILGRQVEDSNCDKLKSEDSQVSVQYTFRRDHARLEAFVLSWDRTQTKQIDDVTLTFDMQIPNPLCGGITVCYSNPVCPGPPRRCEKVLGAPCEPC
jgi:hypothetical protein